MKLTPKHLQQMIREELESTAGVDEGFLDWFRKKKESEVPEKLLVHSSGPPSIWRWPEGESPDVVSPSAVDITELINLFRKMPKQWQYYLLDLVAPGRRKWTRMHGSEEHSASAELRTGKLSGVVRDLLGDKDHGEQIDNELRQLMAYIGRLPAETDGRQTNHIHLQKILDADGWNAREKKGGGFV